MIFIFRVNRIRPAMTFTKLFLLALNVNYYHEYLTMTTIGTTCCSLALSFVYDSIYTNKTISEQNKNKNTNECSSICIH